MSREDLQRVRIAYDSFKEIHAASSLDPLPENELGDDKLLRFLDCAVIRHLHEFTERKASPQVEKIDTVRGLFTEGDDLFPGSGFKAKTHIQISVYNTKCIKGVFRVPLPESDVE
jgi:hypothetical protein